MNAEPQSIGALASKDVDPWRWWQEALAHPELIGGVALRIHESEPQQGYYRVRMKGGEWEPVAIFFIEGTETLAAYRNGKEVSDINSLWTWCCRNPIGYDAYEKAITGSGFADEPTAAPGIGDNSGIADPADALRIEYLGEKEMAEEFLKTPVTTQAAADKAAIWAKKLSDITKRADEFHGIEKRPHLDAGKAVDDRWRELKDEPKALSVRLKRSIDAFAAAQKEIERKRAQAARDEEDRLRRKAAEKLAAIQAEAEKAQYQNSVSDIIGEPDPELQRRQDALLEEARALQASADQKAREAEVQNYQAGRTGAKVSMRTFTDAAITDYDALVMALKDREEVKELIQSLANRAAKAGVELAGMKIRKEERVA